ncbi:MAG: KpsF/GutQ family sugar-phosphate isomerase [Saprospiraceae bacterium]|nr:KpsF/GutQ family sugar-phosphate isomerase [Saprospiraceae bacterium]
MLSNNQKTLICNAARSCIEIERNVINQLLNSINDDFINVVGALFHMKGRVVITGIGKSAIIGQKIVATLNSTGTPALFMHAADALHGDLGMIRNDDIVWCISKSGETQEIKALIPLIKTLGSQFIGMVSQRDSTLAKQADFILHTPVSHEAEPNNLAPTASTTAQVVLGDAVAVALLAMRGFSPQDFAMFHPGGSLGKKLYLRVNHIYPLHGKPKVNLNTSLREVIIEMTGQRLGVSAVLDDDQRIVGIITDGDLRRMLQNSTEINGLCAKDIMSPNPKTIDAEALAVDAFRLMRENNITQLLVADKEIYVGVVHIHDLIKEGII